jgi:hypothetical protein
MGTDLVAWPYALQPKLGLGAEEDGGLLKLLEKFRPAQSRSGC